MDDPGTDHTVNSRKTVSAVIKQSIYKSSAVIARRRMHYHSLWFIDYQQTAILINNIKRNILRFSIQFNRFGNIYFNNISCLLFIILSNCFTVDQYFSAFNKILNCGSGQIFNLRSQPLVKSQTACFFRYCQNNVIHLSAPIHFCFFGSCFYQKTVFESTVVQLRLPHNSLQN